MNHAGHTTPDDIPPVRVLEAAHNQDRKDAENLLAGFDRPGRGPRKPSPERDFVDYYARKKAGRASGPVVVPPPQRDVATVVKPRKAEGMPSRVAWAAAAVLMLGVGGLVAFLATCDTHPNARPPQAPHAAATGVAMTPPVPEDRDIIPPPAPAEPATLTTTPMTVSELAPSVPATEPAPRPAARREPRGVPSPGAASHPNGSTTPASSADLKPPPRDDFIRDL